MLLVRITEKVCITCQQTIISLTMKVRDERKTNVQYHNNNTLSLTLLAQTHL
jgi:hypothetical protein